MAIFSTLGLTRSIVGFLAAEGLLAVAYIFGLLLVLATIGTLGLKTRPRGAEIGIGLGIAAVYLLVFVRMTIPEERTHLIEYGVLAAFVYEALQERASQGKRVPAPALLALAITAFLGLLDESVQAILPNRVYDIRDVGFNALAGLMAIGASLALAWARRRRGPPAQEQGK